MAQPPTTADGGSSTDPRPALEDAAIVIHSDGYELIEVDDTEPTESEAVQRQIDALPDDPGGAAFNAAAHPDHPSVEMVDAAYPFDVAATLRLAHAESGRFDVLGDDQLVRCVNPERESLTWFYGVDGDDGELVDYHELDDFEAAPIERSKALASIASPKVDVSLVDREELDERRERGEAVTDGGVEQDVDRTDRVEPFSGEPADTPEEDEIPPAKDGSINQIPDLSVDDRVRVETSGNYAPDRTLTVESIGSDKQSGGLLETRGEDPGYVLSGYGTEYHLITTGTPYWRAVDIVFPSQPVGQRVASVEIVEEGDDA